MLQNIKAVIFDLDGSLVDSMWIWRQIDIEYLGKFGIALPDNLQKEIEGMSFTETAEYFKERFDLPCTVEEIKQAWNTMSYEKYVKEVPLKEGVGELLCYAKENDIALGIATSNSAYPVEALLDALQIRHYFSSVMTACDAKKGKPAPDIYLMAAEELCVEPAQCLVFEDITAGIMAGKTAGMRVCAVQDAYSMYQDAEKKELADYYITDFHAVLPRVEE